MQRVLVDHARAKGTQKRGGDRQRKQLHDDMPENVADDEQALVALAEAVDKLNAIDERKAAVVRLRMLGGLSVRDVASILGVARSTIDADWAAAKDWLKEELGLGCALGGPRNSEVEMSCEKCSPSLRENHLGYTRSKSLYFDTFTGVKTGRT